MSLNFNPSFNIHTFCVFILCFFIKTNVANAQIYQHNFGTTTISSHPYTVAPSIFESHLSNSSWSNSINAWTSTTGSTGEAIRLTTAAAATITLTFTVAPTYQVEVTSFDFWRQRSSLGPQNWSMTINGIAVGNGTTPTTGAALGNTPVSNTISGLTGTITVVISLTGSTGNGTFRLDDFTLNGSVTSNCASPIITSFFPASGPQNTLVTITGSGFQAGTGTSAVKFNGINATSFSVESNTVIKAYVPGGNASGNISIVTNGCEGISPTSFTIIETILPITLSTDVYISEIYDAQTGDRGIFEIYNGTALPINLTGYTIRRYGDIGDTTPTYSYALTGIIQPGTVLLFHIGVLGYPTPCGLDDQGVILGQGFNANDKFELVKNSIVIDTAHAPNNAGYSLIRNANAIAPKVVFDSSDWGITGTEDCSGLGAHTVTVVPPPSVTQPTSKIICENGSTSFSTSLANDTGYTYQWKVIGSSGTWSNVANGSPYSGATTSVLTINPTPLSFDNNQYYCQITSITTTVVSNAAQLEVNPGLIVPNFNTPLAICTGGTAPVLNTTSPNGITGTWSPTTVSNTSTADYIFTPNAGQCAVPFTLHVDVNSSITPNFATPIAICNGSTAPTLNTTSPNGITGTWSPATVSNTTTADYIFTPNAGQCAMPFTLHVDVNSSITPNFATPLAICNGGTAPVLNTTSPNGITGTWSPATVSNTTTADYIFTPNAGQCAVPFTLHVDVNPSITPNFATPLAICTGGTAPVLNTTSPNGITGTWSPATVSNTTTADYIFTPNAGQCAVPFTLHVDVNSSITPNFATPLAICNGATAPVLNNTSPNGITGTWSPSTVSNTTTGDYIFTPNVGQCAVPFTLHVDVNSSITPNFSTPLAICTGGTAPVLNTTSPNGIIGTWSPSTVSNTTSADYIFTPNVGQCAVPFTLHVDVNSSITPNFSTPIAICNGGTAPVLNTTSPNGITGTWSPATVSNTTTADYIFTPNAGQCAVPFTLHVDVNSSITPNFATPIAICNGSTAPILNTTSPNGITGTWSPSTVSNTTTADYIFTPNAGQCAVSFTLHVDVNSSITPNFATPIAICNGSTAPILNTTSPNGITGTWSPAVVSNTTTADYIFTPNAGQCAAPFTLHVDVNSTITPNFATPLAICNGSTAPTLNTTSPNGITGTWSPSTVSNTTTADYIFTPNAGQCAVPFTLHVDVNPSITPNFATPIAICNGSTAPVLNTTSPNGITGTWSPATVSNTTTADYIFTPNAGQCAVPFTLHVDVNPSITPNFATPIAICNGATAPILNTTSPNGITGTWSPSTVSNTTTADYIFTPNAGQCAVPFTLHVDVNPSITPNFATPIAICNGSTAPVLNTTSPNGITGTWSPATVSNTTTADYIFTPNAGQCAVPFTLHVDVNPSITPNFVTPIAICNGSTAPILNATSPNGITGTWSPATVSNTTTADYIFTPNAGQCAVPFTLHVDVNPNITPNFVTPIAICNGSTAPILNTTSPNGITGTWSPAVVSNTATADYIFTPNAGQCAVPFTLHVDVNPSITPNFATPIAICNGSTAPVLNTTSPNGIIGTWSPSTVSNTTTADYIFTPNVGQCAVPFTLHVDVNSSITPNFATPIAICNGSTAPVLNTTSPNGITGTWSPATVSNTTTADYIFTPNAGQCAVPFTLHVDVNPSVTPNFATPIAICNGSTAPVLNTTSPNGITGTWSPSTVSNTTTADYIFTPNAGQCAVPFTLHVDVTPSITPDFPTSLIICPGDTVPLLNTTSPNGITGTWTPAVVSNTVTANYLFVPNAGQCASVVTFSVTINDAPTPVLVDTFLCVDNTTAAILAPVTLSSGVPSTNHDFIWKLNGNILPTITNFHIARQPGVYEVTATNRTTGCSATATATVGTSSLAIASASVGDDFDRSQTITVNVTGGSGLYEFQLNDGPPQDSNLFTNIYEGEYDITVKDKNGCGKIVLNVYALNYPRYFTPNSDGFNDYWNINGLYNQPKALIYIFDRYGKLLTSIRPSSTGWDGKYNGNDLPATDYWFLLNFQNRAGEQKEFRAHFSLKR